jgi:site-specific recombinase XerD
MRLEEQYLQWAQRNHPPGRPPRECRLVEGRIRSFLRFCEGRGIDRIRRIGQPEVAAYLDRLARQGKAPSTVYRVRLALREFAESRRLPVHLARDHRPARRLIARARVREIIEAAIYLSPEQRTRLLADLEEVKR